MSDEIDLNTGLPALPEDYFWRVVDTRWEWTEKIPPTIYLMRTIKITVPTYPKHWWQKNGELEGTDEVRVLSQRINDTPLSAAAIRDAAIKVMQNWADLKVRQALIGDYPPKKLEDN